MPETWVSFYGSITESIPKKMKIDTENEITKLQYVYKSRKHMNLGRKSSGKDVGETGVEGMEDGFAQNTLCTYMKFSNI